MEFNNYISDKVNKHNIYITMDGNKEIQINNANICVLNENVIKQVITMKTHLCVIH